MNTTKPSAGALRAAEAICQMVPCCNDPDHLTNIYRLKEINRIAVIINSESGLVELLEAARDAQCDCSPKERDSGHKSECWFPALQEAIAKASNPNADVQQVAPAGRWTEKGTV